MEPRNQTMVKEFILAAFSQNLLYSILFFISLLMIYLFTAFANSFLMITVVVSPKLHLPMYYLLCNLSFIDVCYSSSSLPKVLSNTFSRRRTILVTDCMVQMNIGTFLGGTESLLLAVMAYDRYMAICLPLYYNQIMNWTICRNIMIAMWSGNFLISVVPIISRPMVFCTANTLDHFVCEILVVLELVCRHLTYYKLTIFVVSFFTLALPLVFIVGSYVLIISSILKIQSTDGRSKAFSTCASHLTVVSMFYGPSISMYIGQKKSLSSNVKYFSMAYGLFTPLLNPLIYSLRNNDVKEAVQKMLTKRS